MTGKSKDNDEERTIEQPRAEAAPTVSQTPADDEPARPASAPNPTNAS